MYLYCFFLGPKNKRRISYALAAAPFAIFSGLAFTVLYLITAIFFGPELPSLVGSLIGPLILLLATKKNFLKLKDSWDFPAEKEWGQDWKGDKITGNEEDNRGEVYQKMPLWLAWLPYFLIALVLLITRISALGIKSGGIADFIIDLKMLNSKSRERNYTIDFLGNLGGEERPACRKQNEKF